MRKNKRNRGSKKVKNNMKHGEVVLPQGGNQQENKSFEIQNDIRQNALNFHENIKNLKQWEEDMKASEKKLQQQKAEEPITVSICLQIDVKKIITCFIFLP